MINQPSGKRLRNYGKIHHAMKMGKPSISIRAIYTIAFC